jgi:hypothetical protein
MAVRTNVLKLNASNELEGMTAAEIVEIQEQAVHVWATDPNQSVTLSVVATDGNLNRMTDSFYKAGAASSTNTSFPAAAAVVLNQANYDHIDQTVEAAGNKNAYNAALTNPEIEMPLFINDDGDIQAMSVDDFYDTFIVPTISLLVAPSGPGNLSGGGLYAVYSDNATKAGFTIVDNAQEVFQDTQANVTDFGSGNLPEAIDQRVLDTPYFLYKKNTTAKTHSFPLFGIGTGANFEVREYAAAAFNTMLAAHMNHAASGLAGSRIRYQIKDIAVDNAGTTMGEVMEDEIYAESTGRTQQIGDTYYAQNVPSGSKTIYKSYALKVELT